MGQTFSTNTSFGGRASVSNGVATTVYSYDPVTLALTTETVSYDFNGDQTADFTRVIERSRDVHNRESGWELKDGALVENEVAYRYDTAGRMDEVESPAGTFAYSYLAGSGLIATVTGWPTPSPTPGNPPATYSPRRKTRLAAPSFRAMATP